MFYNGSVLEQARLLCKLLRDNVLQRQCARTSPSTVHQQSTTHAGLDDNGKSNCVCVSMYMQQSAEHSKLFITRYNVH